MTTRPDTITKAGLLGLIAATGICLQMRTSRTTTLPPSPATVPAKGSLQQKTSTATHSRRSPEIALPDHAKRSIDEQIVEALYRFVECDEGSHAFAATNNRNGFSARFEEEVLALTVRPFDGSRSADWSWRMMPKTFATNIDAGANGGRLSIDRGHGVTEWFVNEPRGIEQGFTLPEPLPDGRLAMTVETDLVPQMTDDGDAQEIRFDDPFTHETRLRYAELFVTDAKGDRVPAAMEITRNVARHSNAGPEHAHGLDFGMSSYEIALVLDDTDARYPLTVDPTITALEAEIVDSVHQGGGNFGTSAAISGDVMVVGNGQSQAFVFERLAATLLAEETISGDRFGATVATAGGEWIAIGAPGHDLSGAPDAGSVYLFKRSTDDDWQEMQTLRPTDAQASARFGTSLGMCEESFRLVIGAPGHANGSGRVFGALRDGAFTDRWKIDSVAENPEVHGFGTAVSLNREHALVGGAGIGDSGAVSVLRHLGTGYDIIRTFHGESGSRLGASVAVGSGDYGVVGEPGAGRAHAIDLHRTALVPLSAPSGTGNEGFGTAVAINDGFAFVSAPHGEGGVGAIHSFALPHSGEAVFPYRDAILSHRMAGGNGFGSAIAASGRNLAAGSPNAHAGRGMVEVHRQRVSHWRPVRSDGGPVAEAGLSMAIDGDTMAIGSPHSTVTASDGSLVNGLGFVFQRNLNSGGWGLATFLVPSRSGENFGADIDVSGDQIVVGAPAGDVVYFFERQAGGNHVWRETTRHGLGISEYGKRVAISGNWAVAITEGGNTNAHFYERGFRRWNFFDSVVPQSEHPVAGDIAIDGTRAVLLSINSGLEGQDRIVVMELSDHLWEIADVVDIESTASGSTGASSVALSGTTIAVGVCDDGLAFEGPADLHGAVFVFEQDSSGLWNEEQRIHPLPVTVEGDRTIVPQGFGQSVALEDDLLVTGMVFAGQENGVAFVYERNGNAWSRMQSFVGEHPSFGRRVALSGTTVAVTAPLMPGAGGEVGATFVYRIDPVRDEFDAWRRKAFGNAVVDNPALEDSVWSAGADPDRDGLTNLVEAYHGFHPLVADSSTPLRMETTGGATLRWQRGLQTGGIVADLQWSRDLRRWFGIHDAAAPRLVQRIAAEETDHLLMEASAEGAGPDGYFRLRYRMR